MKSKVALVKGDDRRANIRRSLELICGDIITKVSGQKVIIKPNCLQSAIPLSCTHVDAVRGILDFLPCLSPGSVIVAETCNDSEHFGSFRRLGYMSLPDEYSVSLIDLQEEDDWVEMPLLNKDCQEVKVKVSRALMDCGCRISAASAKTHDTVIITAGWKNMMGAIALDDKVKMHGCNSHRERVLTSEVEILPQNLIRLAKFIPPHISVIDGFIGMEGDGPVRGNEKYLGIAIASTDYVAADAVCAKAMGFDPMEISYLYYGHQLGLGTADINDIHIVGDSLEEVAGNFTPHSNYRTQMLWRELIQKIS